MLMACRHTEAKQLKCCNLFDNNLLNAAMAFAAESGVLETVVVSSAAVGLSHGDLIFSVEMDNQSIQSFLVEIKNQYVQWSSKCSTMFRLTCFINHAEALQP